MKPSEQERLWRELFSDEKLAEASLERGMAALRRKRRRRVVIPTTAAAALAVAFTVATAWRHPRPALGLPMAEPKAVSAAPASTVPTPALKMINDQELFALFPGRAAALIGAPGEQRLVFLDGRGDAP